MSSSDLPQVSVIIPTYNCDRYIVQAVKSVLLQKHCTYEILVIDDGSTDNTNQVLTPYGQNIRYIYQQNQGVALARNHGIEQAHGEFVAFLDADDYFFSNKLAAQIARFEAQPELGIVHSGWRRVNSQGKTLIDIRPWQYSPNLNLETWLKWKPVLPSAMMFRRQWLEKVGGFDPRYPPAEDTEMILRLSLQGCKAGWLRRITTGYRQHEQSAMFKGLPQARSLSAAMDNFFAQPDLPQKIRLIENDIRYNTLVWIAWYLHTTGHYPEMVEYLQKAWHYKPYLPIETIITWVNSFNEFAKSWAYTFDAEALGKSPEWQQLVQWLIADAQNHSLAN